MKKTQIAALVLTTIAFTNVSQAASHTNFESAALAIAEAYRVNDISRIQNTLSKLGFNVTDAEAKQIGSEAALGHINWSTPVTYITNTGLVAPRTTTGNIQANNVYTKNGSSVESSLDGLNKRAQQIEAVNNNQDQRLTNLENAPKPQDGKDGAPGRDGIDGKDGAPGRDGIDGKDGAPGRDGIDGKDGAPGRDGIDGKDADMSVVSKNSTDIATNATNIDTNKTAIEHQANLLKTGMNWAGAAVGKLQTESREHAAGIDSNKTAIAKNGADIATNQGNIETNKAAIEHQANLLKTGMNWAGAAVGKLQTESREHAAGIDSNKTAIAKNGADIATNQGNIETNKAAIEHQSDLLQTGMTWAGAAVGKLQTESREHAAGIDSNKTAIAKNGADIATNQGNIETNKAAIEHQSDLLQTGMAWAGAAVGKLQTESREHAAGIANNAVALSTKVDQSRYESDKADQGMIDAAQDKTTATVKAT
ncbi:collagen-like protein, partial [Salmonella enterica]|nr:collagen-like protein [Salmonella enterica]